MLDRQWSKIIFVCDGCDDTLNTKMTNITDAMFVLKDNYWICFKSNSSGKFVHVCPDCENEI